MNFAKSAISQVPTSTLMEIFVMSPPLLPSFFGLNCAHGVSLRTKRKSASTRLAGVDSLHVSSSLTTQSSSLSMSRQFSSLIISDGRLSMDGKSSDVYLPKVALKQSWSSSVLDWKHSGPSSAMNTESGRNRVGWRKQLDGRLHSHAIWLPFSWQMNSRRLLVMLTKTVFWSFSSAVRHGSRDFVKSSTHSSARLRLLQYLLKTVSKLPLGLACSISSVRLLMLTNFCTHSIRVVVACCRWRFYDYKKGFFDFLLNSHSPPHKPHRFLTPWCTSLWTAFWPHRRLANYPARLAKRLPPEGHFWCRLSRYPSCWLRHMLE